MIEGMLTNDRATATGVDRRRLIREDPSQSRDSDLAQL